MTATAAAFAAGALASLGLLGLLGPALSRVAASRRLRATALADSGVPGLLRVLVRVGRAAAARARPPRALADRIAAAGLAGGGRGPRPLEVRDVMAAKLAACAAAGAAGVLLGGLAPGRIGLALVVVAPAAGFLGPDAWLARRAARRAAMVRRELPAMLDLLRVTIAAGLSLTAALQAVGARSRGVLGAEWRTVAREVALGVPLAGALSALERRLPLPEVKALLAALERALRHGSPLAGTLAGQARDARAARRRRIREAAAQAGPKIQLVVAMLLVPSVLLLVAAALVAALAGGGGELLVI